MQPQGAAAAASSPAAAPSCRRCRPWLPATPADRPPLASSRAGPGRGRAEKMGNTTSCCVSSSPKLRRNAHSRLESYRPEAELSREDTGCNLQHISDRENIDGERGRAPRGAPAPLPLPYTPCGGHGFAPAAPPRVGPGRPVPLPRHRVPPGCHGRCRSPCPPPRGSRRCRGTFRLQSCSRPPGVLCGTLLAGAGSILPPRRILWQGAVF